MRRFGASRKGGASYVAQPSDLCARALVPGIHAVPLIFSIRACTSYNSLISPAMACTMALMAMTSPAMTAVAANEKPDGAWMRRLVCYFSTASAAWGSVLVGLA
jgi:hypothetical protein